MKHCPVCGGVPDPEVEVLIEDERYVGDLGCEMNLMIWYCNVGKTCSAVAAANVLDKLGEEFIDMVGEQ